MQGTPRLQLSEGGARESQHGSIADLKDEVLFINPELCFTLRYLQFSENLLFFGPMSSSSVSDTPRKAHDSQ